MKRLIICADGTWNKPDRRDMEKKRKDRYGEWIRKPTNVVKMARAIKPEAKNETHQVVYYDPGVGTGWGILDPIVGGAFGHGLSKNILDCYRFLVHNYDEGDELYFFGFSRGAFTARSLAGFIHRCGLLTKDDAYYIPEAYEHYRLKLYEEEDIESIISRRIPQWIPGRIRDPIVSYYRSHYRKVDEENRKKVKEFRSGPAPRNHIVRDVKIKFIGVWDTVGALGLPFGGIFGYWINKKYAFHNVKLGSNVDNAYHALAIDERRKPFKPTLWNSQSIGSQKIKQVWFAGVHTNVGGGCDPDGIANCAFQWMFEKLAGTGLEFDTSYTDWFQADPRSELRNSMTLFYRLWGEYPRPIGEKEYGYEDVHWSAKARLEAEGQYRPNNLLEYLEKRAS